MQRDRATLSRTEGPLDATCCAKTARCHVVQRDHATLQRTEKPRDTTSCRGTARRYIVQRPRVATACRGTTRRHVVQRDRATLRGVETARRCSVQRKIVQIKVVLRLRRRPIVLDRRRSEPDAPFPSRRALDAGEPTPNTLSVPIRWSNVRPNALSLCTITAGVVYCSAPNCTAVILH